jgi:hypothetical protein
MPVNIITTLAGSGMKPATVTWLVKPRVPVDPAVAESRVMIDWLASV